MLKVLMSDLHFGSNQNSKYFLDMQVGYFRDFVVPFMIENGIKQIEFLGDVFHHKELTDNNVKKEFLNIIKNEFNNFHVRIILGNHDIYYRDSLETHSLHFIEDLPNVNIINEMTLITEGNANQLYVPWIVDQKDFEEQFDKFIANTDVNIVMGHFEMSGFPLNKLHDAKHGKSAENMNLESISKVFSGHYHTPSKRLFGECVWQYLGSPFQHTRIDSGDKKGFVVFDTETLKYDFIYSENIMEFVNIEFDPKSKTLPDESEIFGNSVDVITTTDEVGKVKFNKFVESLKAMKPTRLEIKAIPTSILEDGEETSMKSSDGSVRTVIDLIKDYLTISESDESMRELVSQKIVELHTEAEESVLQSEMSDG